MGSHREVWGQNIRREREKLGLSQADLAKLIGTSQPRVTDWEAGRNAPSLEYALALARVFHCSLTWLFPGEGES